MTIEERIELREQWLHSIESNHNQIVSDLARTERVQSLMAEQLLAVGQNQALFAANLAALGTEMRELRDYLRALSETVDRYIRFRSNGSESN